MAIQSQTLAFLSYGEGIHVDETVFSILSALYWLKEPARIRMVVMTDTPQRFDRLGVEVDILSPELLDKWLGTGSYYKHRRKLEAMKYALSRYGGALALVDGDTWFRRSPEALFNRIGPGRCCLHLLESKLVDSGAPGNLALAEALGQFKFRRQDGTQTEIAPNSAMWNSGVIGLHSHDLEKMDDALHLLDQLIARAPSVHTVEQFAISQALAGMDLRETGDIVFHYWPQRIRSSFRAIISDALADTEQMPPLERAKVIFALRPKASPKRRLVLGMKRLMQLLNLPVVGVRASG